MNKIIKKLLELDFTVDGTLFNIGGICLLLSAVIMFTNYAQLVMIFWFLGLISIILSLVMGELTRGDKNEKSIDN